MQPHDAAGLDRSIMLGVRLEQEPAVPIACSLSPADLGPRIADWRSVASESTGREDIPGGTRLRFDRDVDVPRLAALIAAEQGCCQFFTFRLTVAIDAVSLDVVAEAEAEPMIDALVGAAP